MCIVWAIKPEHGQTVLPYEVLGSLISELVCLGSSDQTNESLILLQSIKAYKAFFHSYIVDIFKKVLPI